jgi:hypothetical protein
MQIQLSEIGQEVLMEHLSDPENGEPLEQYCSTALAMFYSLAREVHRPLKELRLDYYRYVHEEAILSSEPSFLRHIKKFLILANLISFLQKALSLSLNLKEELEAPIFHTYIRIERELKREHVSRMLMPILRSYYD